MDNHNSADSAGQQWEGRHFEPNAHSDDDGSADPRVIGAIEAFRALALDDAGRPAAQSALVTAVTHSRLLMPLVAEAGDEGFGPNGLVVDKTQELALVTVMGPNGQKVMPAFTSVAAMTAWRADARPVPVEARRAALAASLEEVNWIVLDPVSPTEVVLRRPAVEAIAKAETWIPAHVDPELLAAFETSIANDPFVRSVRLAPGDPDARGMHEDLIVQLVLVPSLGTDDVRHTLESISNAWSAQPLIVSRVDAMKIRIVSG